MYPTLSVVPVLLTAEQLIVSKVFVVAGTPSPPVKSLALFFVATSLIPMPPVLIVPTLLLTKILSAVSPVVLLVLLAIAVACLACVVCRFVMSVPCVPCVVCSAVIAPVFVVC